jgi:hypothetical protein
MTATGFAFAVALAAAPANAANTLMQVDDRTDTISFLTNGNVTFTAPDSGFNYFVTVGGLFTGVNVGFQIMEPGSSAISDLMNLVVTPGVTATDTAVSISFISDTDGVPLTAPPGFFTQPAGVPPEIIPETGNFATVYDDIINADSSLKIQFASDVVPEPSTWVMMALGFAGLCIAGYRAKRQHPARMKSLQPQ